MTARALVRAPAKVNLALRVVGKRADGYHTIVSAMTFAASAWASAWVEAERTRDEGWSLRFVGPYAQEAPQDASELVGKAARALGLAGVRARIYKALPAGMGFGAASAEVAAFLRAMVALGVVSQARVEALAVGLGADVPACLLSCPLLARGIGERLTPTKPTHSVAAVLVAARASKVSAAAAYRAWDATCGSDAHDAHDDAPDALTPGNSLAAPVIAALAPEVGGMLESLRGQGAREAGMSGSGAGCWATFADMAHAQAVAQAMAAVGHWARASYLPIAEGFKPSAKRKTLPNP